MDLGFLTIILSQSASCALLLTSPTGSTSHTTYPCSYLYCNILFISAKQTLNPEYFALYFLFSSTLFFLSKLLNSLESIKLYNL